MYTNTALATHQTELIHALGSQAPDRERLALEGKYNFDKALSEALWDAVTSRQIIGRLALRYIQGYDMLLHGTPRTYDEIRGVLQPSIPCRRDEQGRLFPMGKAAVCASVSDIEQPIRKALLHHDRPELENVAVVLWRSKDDAGRPWHFTSKQALTKLSNAGSAGTVMFWQSNRRVRPFFDEARRETYPNEQWIPKEVKVPEGQWTTVRVDDLALDYASGVPDAAEDLFVIDASPSDSKAFLRCVGTAANFIELSDEMGISVTPISGHYPAALHPLAQ